MANTTHCSISAATVIEGQPLIKWVNLAATDKPGMAEYLSATKTATKADSDSVAQSVLQRMGIVEYKPRVSSTDGTRKTPEDNYATSDQTPLIIGGREGPVQVVCCTIDQNAAKLFGHRMIVHTTAGYITVSAAANTATGLRLARSMADDDTYCACWMSP